MAHCKRIYAIFQSIWKNVYGFDFDLFGYVGIHYFLNSHSVFTVGNLFDQYSSTYIINSFLKKNIHISEVKFVSKHIVYD